VSLRRGPSCRVAQCSFPGWCDPRGTGGCYRRRGDRTPAAWRSPGAGRTTSSGRTGPRSSQTWSSSLSYVWKVRKSINLFTKHSSDYLKGELTIFTSFYLIFLHLQMCEKAYNFYYECFWSFGYYKMILHKGLWSPKYLCKHNWVRFAVLNLEKRVQWWF